jgi:ferredoxin
MRVDKKKCVGCANCVPVCPVGAIYIADDKLADVNQDTCVECNTCYRGLSVEHLPSGISRFLRRCLASVGLRFQPVPDVCPTAALVQEKLEWPRIVRSVFSDPQLPHESTGIHGRGTAEVKSNDVTGRVKDGEAGFVVEFGRPGVGVYFREVDRATRLLASRGVTFERENPVTSMMTDPSKGTIREDVLDERVLSCIVEAKITLDRVPELLKTIKDFSRTVETVISIGVSTRCDSRGEDPLREVLKREGYDTWRAKVNLGLGRRSNPQSSAKEARA